MIQNHYERSFEVHLSQFLKKISKAFFALWKNKRKLK